MNLEDIKKQREVKSISIFGAGLYARLLCEYYGKENIIKNINAFIVSEKGKNPKEICGVPVITIKEVNDFLYAGVLIIAISKDKRNDIDNSIYHFSNIMYIEEVVSTAFLQDCSKKNRNNEIDNYYKLFKEHPKLFKYIEIETINRCNGTCSFCPVNANEVQRPYLKMSDDMFYHIIDELEQMQYSGKVALFSNNEAFLDSRIIKFAAYTRDKLQNAYIYITTNGTLLNRDNFLEIITYLDALNIDIYKDGDEKDPENIEDIISLAKSNNLMNKIRISRIKRNKIRSSRGGKSPNSKVQYTINDKCPLLLVQLVVRPDGKVSLCCNDALGEMTLGDVTSMSLSEIWYGSLYNILREKNMNSRENIKLCKFCDYVDMREL